MSLARVLALSSKRGGSSILARAATFVAPRSIGEPPPPSSPLVDRVPSAGPHGPATCCGALREIQTPVSEQSCDSSLWHLPARVSAHICENTICILFSGIRYWCLTPLSQVSRLYAFRQGRSSQVTGPAAGRRGGGGPWTRERDGLYLSSPARGEDDSRGSRQSTNERRYSGSTRRVRPFTVSRAERERTPRRALHVRDRTARARRGTRVGATR
jgi:hypothetical protein